MLALHRALSFTLVALSLLQFAHAHAIASNAQRLARGLAPAPPKRLFDPHYRAARDDVPSSLPTSASASDPASATPPPSSSASSASSSSDPSSASSASSSSASSASSTPILPTPGTVQTGAIGVYATSTAPTKKRDTFLGYMGAYGLSSTFGTGAASDGWTYSFTEPDPLSAVVQLNHPSTPYRLTGVAIRSGPQVTLGPGNAYYLELQNSRASTPAGSAASTYVYDTYAIGYAQTTIFRVDPASGRVSVQWVNPDGSLPQTYVAAHGSSLYVTGDPAALATQLGATPTPVAIFLERPSAAP
ncbi:hypothetical protein PHLGIDRAFT_35888 [Phlebiopsis gigantea 11061_1 CR5-6]|uniref:Uncharacterized protein n=1 Tax=Phlebiopsis gigantea (strain 11061_1 CR5-6) TaxID=745531 RepID=A0A0C3NNA0_PHLG1|nr:hypothetical protein PHLGIDRAFT_35888 [Phlebiopsis gigantea 11061_1 CR5-6]